MVECHYVQCGYPCVVRLNVVMMSIFELSVIVASVVNLSMATLRLSRPSVVKLNVAALGQEGRCDALTFLRGPVFKIGERRRFPDLKLSFSP